MSSESILTKVNEDTSKSLTIDQTLNFFNCFSILKNAFSDLNINVVEFYKRNGSDVECTLTVTKLGQTYVLGKGESDIRDEAKSCAAKAALIVFLTNNRPVKESQDGKSSYNVRCREKLTVNSSLPSYMEEVRNRIRKVINGIIDNGKLIKDLASIASDKENLEMADHKSLDKKIIIVSDEEHETSTTVDPSVLATSSTDKIDNSTMIELRKALTRPVIEEILKNWNCFISLRNAFKSVNINVVDFYIRKGDNVECTLTVAKEGQTWILGMGKDGSKRKAKGKAAENAVKTFLEKKFPVKRSPEGDTLSSSWARRRRRDTKGAVPEYMYHVRNRIFAMAKNNFIDLFTNSPANANEAMATLDSSVAKQKEEEATSVSSVTDEDQKTMDHKSSEANEEPKSARPVTSDKEDPSIATRDESSPSTEDEILSESVIETILGAWNSTCFEHLCSAFKKVSISVIDFYIRKNQNVECTLTVTKKGQTWNLGIGEGNSKETAKCYAAKCAIQMFLENKTPVLRADKQRRSKSKKALPEYMNEVRAHLLDLASSVVQNELRNVEFQLSDCKIKEETDDTDETKSKDDDQKMSPRFDQTLKDISDDEAEELVLSVVNDLVSPFERQSIDDVEETDTSCENNPHAIPSNSSPQAHFPEMSSILEELEDTLNENGHPKSKKNQRHSDSKEIYNLQSDINSAVDSVSHGMQEETEVVNHVHLYKNETELQVSSDESIHSERDSEEAIMPEAEKGILPGTEK